MDFITTIENLPDLRKETIERIADETHSTKHAVWRWLRGGTVPEVKKEIIAKVLNKSVEELFPENQ